MISNGLVMVPLILLVVTIHEATHGIVSVGLGVPLAEVGIGFPLEPQVTVGEFLVASEEGVNAIPFRLSPWLLGAYVMPAVDYFDLPPWKSLLILLAGPISNLMVAGMCNLLIEAAKKPLEIPMRVGPWNFWETSSRKGFFRAGLIMFYVWNLNVGVFNLFPIPPLDGGKAVISAIFLVLGKSIDVELTMIASLVGAGIVMLIVFRNLGGVAKFLFGK